MIKRYIAARNNPWELLVVAAMVFVPGVIMVLQQRPMVAFPQAYRGPLHWIEVISPHVAHIFGVLAIAFSALIVVLYFWTRQAIARDPGPHVVQHVRRKSSNQSMERTATRQENHRGEIRK